MQKYPCIDESDSGSGDTPAEADNGGLQLLLFRGMCPGRVRLFGETVLEHPNQHRATVYLPR